MHDALDRRLAGLQRRLRWQRAVDAAGPWCAVGLGLAGIGVLIVRLALPAAVPAIPVLIAAGVLVAVPWLLRGMLRRESTARAAGALDRLAGAEGLVMALAAQKARDRDPVYRARAETLLRQTALPSLSLRESRGALLAVVCLLAALALPQQPAPPLPTAHQASALLARSAQHVAESAPVIAPDEHAALQQTLERLRQHAAEHGGDQSLWDGVDRLAARVDAARMRTARSLGQALAAAGALAAPQDAGRSADALAAETARALAELAAAAPQLVPQLPAGVQGQALRAALAHAAQQAADAGLLGKAQADALAKAGVGADPVGADGAADPAAEQALGALLTRELGAARERLRQAGLPCADGESGDEGESDVDAGGVDRGPGHVPLRYREALRTAGGYQDGLAPGQRGNSDPGVTLATQLRAAEADPAAAAAAVRAGSVNVAPAFADARSARVAPRHRAVVSAYFPSATSAR